MNKPFFIGVSGGSGSGKTTFLRGLAERFHAADVCFISQDDYYKPRTAHPIDAYGFQNFDLPTGIDVVAFEEDLKKLTNGETVFREEYIFNNERAQPKILTFEPRKVIIVEGLFIFYFPEILNLLDFKIFIDARDDLKIIRRIKRDKNERNYPIDDVLHRYEHHVMPAYERYIKPYKQRADVIINNHDDFGNALTMVAAFIDRLSV
jgi:uridine kinase